MSAATIGKLTFGTGTFEVVINDLLYEPVECIGTAANGGLSHGGGVAADILAAAGPKFDEECREFIRTHGRIPTGGTAVTTAGQLPFKGVIHAVGPRLSQGDEENKLVETLRNAFLRADERGWKSLAFPAISSGIYAVPHDICARAYLRAVREFFTQYPQSPLKTIRLALFKGLLVERVRQELFPRAGSFPSESYNADGRHPRAQGHR
jgi:O-acetyl-ADP-ribose deacetylase